MRIRIRRAPFIKTASRTRANDFVVDLIDGDRAASRFQADHEWTFEEQGINKELSNAASPVKSERAARASENFLIRQPGLDGCLAGSWLEKRCIFFGNFFPRGRWNAIIVLVSDDLEQLGCAFAALSGDNAKLGHMPTDGIQQSPASAN
jgi:hypothetical protein